MLAPLNQAAHWNRLAGALNPAWSFTEVRARVVRVVDEAPGVRSLWLKPNRRFGRFQPGQHVLLDLDIAGARHKRCFSLSHAPRADGLIRLTIKRKDEGRVSAAAHALTVGHVVRLGRAQGEFALRDTRGKLLLLAGGSGITPMLSHLHALADAGSTRDVVLLQACRTPADVLFADELRDLATRLPQLQVLQHVTNEFGWLNATSLAARVPDWAGRETLMCGPDGFMATITRTYSDAGLGDQLQSESFGLRAPPIDPDAAAHAVAYGTTAFSARAGQTLLAAAEAAGLQPKFGCRRGICHTCQCRKRSGTVVNLLTGRTSGNGDELIQLCISTPQSAVELAPFAEETP
ncbi:MAG: flavin reductase family protein [Arenimonas sp.]